MILFGNNKGLTKSIEKGDFHCPNCDSVQSFDLKSVRRYVTLYEIPVIPREQLGEYVECLVCLDTYKPIILEPKVNLSQKEFKAEYHAAIKEVMIRMMIADGEVKNAEVKMMQTIYEKVTKNTIQADQLRRDIIQVKSSTDNLSTSLLRLQGNLNDLGKEFVIRAAFYVAMADGDFGESEQEYLGNIGNDLGMTPAHFQGVIATA